MKGSLRRAWPGLVLGALFLLAPAARADVGFGFVTYVGLPLGLVFIPAVLVEALVLRGSLELAVLRAAGISLLANAASTLLGFGLAWVEDLALGPWLYGPKGVSLSYGLLLPDAKTFWTAVLLHLVPAYAASVYLEARVAGALAPGIEARRLRRAMWMANAVSYALMAAALGGITFIPRWH